MTYARFLGLFVVLPILFLVVRYRHLLSWKGLRPMAILLFVVYAATCPWDNLAVKWGLWHFRPELIWGVIIGYLPLEEYLFFGLQTVLVGLWVFARLRGISLAPAARPKRESSRLPVAPPVSSSVSSKEVTS